MLQAARLIDATASPISPAIIWSGMRWQLTSVKRERRQRSLSLESASGRFSPRPTAGHSRLASTTSLSPWDLIVRWSWWGVRSYCGSSGYLSALREGAARIGLDGKPSGVVTAEEEKIAVAQLAQNIARAKNRRLAAAPQTAKPALEVTVSAPAPAISGGPRRLSLSDLREAARRRRA
jgi:hypothetical protein